MIELDNRKEVIKLIDESFGIDKGFIKYGFKRDRKDRLQRVVFPKNL
tara:strand:+ start:344 stop:484 length:141 start_codon:yes stop_codon:yes gene_type:complete